MTEYKDRAKVESMLTALYLDFGIHLLFSGVVMLLVQHPISSSHLMSLIFCLSTWGCAFSFWSAQMIMQRAHTILEQELIRIRTDRDAAKADLRMIFSQLGEPAVTKFVATISTDDFTFVKLLLSGRHGLHPYSLPHPSQRALAGALGSFVGSFCIVFASFFGDVVRLFFGAMLIGSLGGWILGKAHNNDLLSSIIWMISIIEMLATIVFLTY